MLSVCSNMAVLYSQFPLNRWKPLLRTVRGDKMKGAGFTNSEAKLRALCYLASHVHKQVSVIAHAVHVISPWSKIVHTRQNLPTCSKSVNKRSSLCLFTACPKLTGSEQLGTYLAEVTCYTRLSRPVATRFKSRNGC